MKNILLLLFLGVAAIMVAGEKRDEALRQISEHVKSRGKTPWTWVFYGDSITHGARHTYGWRSFQEIFHERIRGEYLIKNDVVINSGSSGYTTRELLQLDYYNRMVKRYQPQVVFLLIGMNDAANTAPNGVNEFASRLEELVKRLESENAIVVLQTYNTIEYKPQQPDYLARYNNLPAYNQVIRDTAKKYDLILVDHDAYWRANASDPDVLHFWLGETIHPGARGHLEMAKLILQELKIYDPNSSSSRVEAGGKMPIKSNGVVIKTNFDDFEVKEAPAHKKVEGGLWTYIGSPKSFTIVDGGVNNSPCLKVLRDGLPGQGILRSEQEIPENRDYKISFKVKVDTNNGVGVLFANKNTIVGGALFISGTPVRGYDAKGVWQPSGIAENFPANDWVNCEINFNGVEKNYSITITSADGKQLLGSVKHPLMKDLQVREVRFTNIMPQKNFSLIDDFEVSVK